jgi:hypothetical protein
MRVLGLDLGVHVGWQLLDGQRQRQHGTFVLPPRQGVDDFATRAVALYDWLGVKLDQFNPALVAFEAPLVPVAGLQEKLESQAHVVRGLIVLAGVVELVVALRNRRLLPVHRARCVEVNVQRAKSQLSGNQWAKKREMIAAAVRRGYHVATEHEADACGVALAALDHVGA